MTEPTAQPQGISLWSNCLAQIRREKIHKPSKQKKTKTKWFFERGQAQKGKDATASSTQVRSKEVAASSDDLVAGRVPHREGRREMVSWHEPRGSIGRRSCNALRRHTALLFGDQRRPCTEKLTQNCVLMKLEERQGA